MHKLVNNDFQSVLSRISIPYFILFYFSCNGSSGEGNIKLPQSNSCFRLKKGKGSL